MKYFLCLIVLVGCADGKNTTLKYKKGDIVLTKLGETGIIINVQKYAGRPYYIDIKDSSQNVSYEESFIVKVIEE